MDAEAAEKIYATALAVAGQSKLMLSRSNFVIAIERQMEESRQHTLALASLRNSASNIYTLPDEVWAEIIRLLSVEESKSEPKRSPNDVSQLPTDTRLGRSIDVIIKLTHVCSYLRSLIKNLPALWTDVDLKSSSVALLCLERSQQLPLRVRSCDPEGSLADSSFPYSVVHYDLTKAMAEATGRMISLNATGLYENLSTIFDAFWDRPFPQLRHLRLEFYGYVVGRATRPCAFDVDYELPPSLISLHICGISISHMSPLFNRLTCLHMRHQMELTFFTTDNLISALEACPELRCLILSDEVDPETPAMEAPKNKAHLPQLEYFKLVNISHTVSRLLDNIVHPADTHLSIIIQDHEGSWDVFADRLPYQHPIRTQLMQNGVLEIECGSEYFVVRSGVLGAGCALDAAFCKTKSGSELRVEGYLDLEYMIRTFAGFISPCCAHTLTIKLGNIDYDPAGFDDNLWITLFSSFPRAKTLAIHSPPSWLEPLSAMRMDDLSPDGILLFDSLEELHISGIWAEDDNQDAISNLRRIFDGRRKRGFAPIIVHLGVYDLDEGQIDEFNKPGDEGDDEDLVKNENEYWGKKKYEEGDADSDGGEIDGDEDGDDDDDDDEEEEDQLKLRVFLEKIRTINCEGRDKIILCQVRYPACS